MSHASLWPPQIDEDTDRDRYMSPLEAKQYGLIDHVIGGDEAGFKVWAIAWNRICFSGLWQCVTPEA